MMLNILFINRMILMERGGGETFDLEMSRHLQNKGVQCSFLGGVPLLSSSCIEWKEANSVYVAKSPYFGWLPWDTIPGIWRIRRADFLMFQYVAFRWVLSHERLFDVIQVCELPEFIYWYKKKGGQLPVVVRLTAPDYYDPKGALKLADAIIASGATMKVVSKTYPDSVNIPNGVDTTRFTYVDPMSSKSNDKETVLLCVARFHKVKGHEMLIRAFERVLRKQDKTKLILIGNGPLLKTICRMARDLNVIDSITIPGETPHQKLPKIYSKADIVVIPSEYESFCFAALEGMASGKPIISTATDWVPRLLGGCVDSTKNSEIVELPGGYVVPIDDSQLMAEAILRLSKNDYKRKQMGMRNRLEVEQKYGWENSAIKLHTLYNEIIKKQ